MKSDLNLVTTEALIRGTELNPADDLRLAFLRSHHEMAGRLRMQAGQVRNAAYEAYGSAANGLRLAEVEEELIRDEVYDRYTELGLEPPAMYHERDCTCPVCSPVYSGAV